MKTGFYFFIFSFLLLSLSVEAKKTKAPVWKPKTFISPNSSGIRASILKEGKSAKPEWGDQVRVTMVRYDGKTKQPISDTSVDAKSQKTILLNQKGNRLFESVMMLGKKGQGYFIYPNANSGDSNYVYLKILKLIKATGPVEIKEIPTDSAVFSMGDPEADRMGDSIFSVVKLVEVPKMLPCGMMKVLNAYKFRLTWFDNGVQHKDILVYIECPENFGKDFFVAGSTYILTGIRLLENHKNGKKVFNMYTANSDGMDVYYCLRIVRK
jgi:hypothetical protein